MKRIAATLALAIAFGASPAHAQYTVKITWTASADAAANPSLTYDVYRASTCGGHFTKINAAPVTSTIFLDTGAAQEPPTATRSPQFSQVSRARHRTRQSRQFLLRPADRPRANIMARSSAGYAASARGRSEPRRLDPQHANDSQTKWQARAPPPGVRGRARVCRQSRLAAGDSGNPCGKRASVWSREMSSCRTCRQFLGRTHACNGL